MSGFILCNQAMLDFQRQYLEHSKPVPFYDYGLEYAAFYPDLDYLSNMIPEEEYEAAGAWWAEMGIINNTTIDWKPRIIKRDGVWPYLERRYGISTEKNRALAIKELAANAGHDPIWLFNWLAGAAK